EETTMTLGRINPEDVYKPNKKIYSQVAVATGGKQVNIAGTVPFDIDQNIVGTGDMRTQVEKILENLERSLAAAGAKP
ncbi:MAG: Rid family hydrolase, partial [Rhodospirillales bacterium]|nr:Rid family hydrolase [Rhodospirillales bacterium]